MKKITLLALLMWSFTFYGQTYLDEGFEGGTFPPTGWVDQAGSTDVNGYLWALSSSSFNNSGITGNSGSKSAWFNELFNLSDGEPVGAPVTKDRWLITPVMNLSAAVTPELTYYENIRFKDFPSDLNGVYYSTDYAGDPTTATWVALNTTFGADADEIWKIRGPFALPTNATVYIGFNFVDTPPVSSEWFIDDVLVRDQPSCYEPSAGNIDSTTFNSATFSWTPDDPGDSLWDVELVDITAGQEHDVDGVVTTGVTVNPHPFSGLAAGNDYEVYVRTDCGAGGKSAWSGPYAFTTPTNNDDCAMAISVTHESNVVTSGSATNNPGNVSGATDSGVTPPTGTADDDVWFSFVATSTSVTIEVENTGTDFDPVIELFSGTCGSLVSKTVEDFTGDNGDETLIDDAIVNGTTYFVRVYDWDGGDPPPAGSFNLKVYRGSVPLQVEELEKNEFSFYPNPVQDRLNLKSPSDIENISVYNMLGQEIIRQTPRTRTTEVDMSTLQTGAYFVKVTINGVTETKQIIKR